MNIEEIKNTLREFQAENGPKFKNTQAEFKKVVSFKKKVYTVLLILYLPVSLASLLLILLDVNIL